MSKKFHLHFPFLIVSRAAYETLIKLQQNNLTAWQNNFGAIHAAQDMLNDVHVRLLEVEQALKMSDFSQGDGGTLEYLKKQVSYLNLDADLLRNLEIRIEKLECYTRDILTGEAFDQPDE